MQHRTVNVWAHRAEGYDSFWDVCEGCVAISLHAVTDAVRDVLVPINRMWPLAQLLPACAALATNSNNRITFEYVMLRGVNDDLASARKLPELLRGIPALLNVMYAAPLLSCPYAHTFITFVCSTTVVAIAAAD